MDRVIKWLEADNDAGTKTRQHAYVHKTCKAPYTREEYNGNVSLCGRSSVINEDELRMSIEELHNEPLDESNACKICLKKFRNP